MTNYTAIRFLLAVSLTWLLAPWNPTAFSASPNSHGPPLELRPGEKYFRLDGRMTFVMGRNPAGTSPEAYDDHFRHAAAAGARFMRIHFTYVPPGERPGEVDAGLLRPWDAVLDSAEKHGLVVLPVLGVWADRNDGSKKETWHRWEHNPFNAERGGPAERPSELFDDTPCRRLWLKRLETFVDCVRRRPSGRRVHDLRLFLCVADARDGKGGPNIMAETNLVDADHCGSPQGSTRHRERRATGLAFRP
jgi:hypothetical protein